MAATFDAAIKPAKSVAADVDAVHKTSVSAACAIVAKKRGLRSVSERVVVAVCGAEIIDADVVMAVRVFD